MPTHSDNSFEDSKAQAQENPFADPVAETQANPFADPDSNTQDNPFTDPAAELQDNPFADPVAVAPSLRTDSADGPASTPNEFLAGNENHQLGFDIDGIDTDQAIGSFANEETALVSDVPAPNAAASGFDWVNPVYLLGLIPLLLIIMAWRWLSEDSELGDSRSRSRSASRSKSYSTTASAAASTALADDPDAKTTTGIFRKVENFKSRPKLEVSNEKLQFESESPAIPGEDDLLFGADKEIEFDRLSAARSAFTESADSSKDFPESGPFSDNLALTLSDSDADLLQEFKAFQQEKKELAILLDSMRSQLNSTIQLQQKYESEWQHLQSRRHQQLETKDREKGEMQQLLKSTAGATETVTALVTEFQRQLDAAKVERIQLRELLKTAQLATDSVEVQRAELQQQLEANDREKHELREQLRTTETAAESAKTQLAVFQQQLEATKSEKAELRELLKSTASATESISTLVVELQQRLESTKLENTELMGMLQMSEQFKESTSQQVAALQTQLEEKAQAIKSLELQLAQASSAPRVSESGLLVNGASKSGSAYSQNEKVGPAVKKKFTILYRAYERERNLRKESEAQLAKTDEQRLNVAKTLEGIKQELSESQPAEAKDQESKPVLQFSAEKRELSEKIAALQAELLPVQRHAKNAQNS